MQKKIFKIQLIHISTMCYLEFCIGDFSFPLIQSITYISMESWIIILYLIKYINKLYGLSFSTTFTVQIAPALVNGSSINWLLCPLDTPELWGFVFQHFLTFSCYKMLQTFLVLIHLLPQSQNQLFLQGTLVPFIGEQYLKPRAENQV